MIFRAIIADVVDSYATAASARAGEHSAVWTPWLLLSQNLTASRGSKPAWANSLRKGSR